MQQISFMDYLITNAFTWIFILQDKKFKNGNSIQDPEPEVCQ